MLENLRNLGRFVVTAMVTAQGVVLLVVGLFALLGVVDIVVYHDVNRFLFHLLLLGIIMAVVFLVVWIHKDATSELKNLERQKEELKAKGDDREGIEEVKPQDPPWLYP